jgi:hypothetical protein
MSPTARRPALTPKHGRPVALAISAAAVREVASTTHDGPTKAKAALGENAVFVVLQDTLTRRRCLTCAGGGRRSCSTSCTREIEQVIGRTAIGFTSDNHIDAALTVEVLILEPPGTDPAVQTEIAVADPAP